MRTPFVSSSLQACCAKEKPKDELGVESNERKAFCPLIPRTGHSQDKGAHMASKPRPDRRETGPKKTRCCCSKLSLATFCSTESGATLTPQKEDPSNPQLRALLSSVESFAEIKTCGDL
ncbi:hypothetical protein lerEdw1_008808 [Lerista edwardsae]|nr:hypothetical protein lerEdw1_008808 [Lerista edwardsae]